MNNESFHSHTADIAKAWCEEKGEGWNLIKKLGEGKTAPVFEIHSPDGDRALKIYDQNFSNGPLADTERERLESQLRFKNHDCASLVNVYEAGTFQNRLFVLMSRARGIELEKCLHEVPRTKIRLILRDIATACLFLNSHQVCHRDIKAANIFVTEDFSHATLLDIGVIRDIYDPVGVGTDHDGQLPVVATARYSSPEYLFRLIEPGPELWHALNIYQLGALLHDLIVRVPLFQEEFEASQSNRYRFAWIVATENPQIDVTDVDSDLIYLARRALDKNWLRRSELRVENFLNTDEEKKELGLQILGLRRDRTDTSKANVYEDNQHLDSLAGELANNLSKHFKSKYDVVTQHNFTSGPVGDDSREVVLQWIPNATNTSTIEKVALRCKIILFGEGDERRFGLAVSLSTKRNGQCNSVSVDLPDMTKQEISNNPTQLSDLCKEAFKDLATNLFSTDNQV